MTPSTRKAEPAPAPQPEPPRKERPTFEADWEAAVALLPVMQKAWKKRTEEQLKVLTADERDEVSGWIGTCAGDPAGMGGGLAAMLSAKGFGDAVRSIGSKWAVGDKEFRQVAKRTWTADSGRRGIIDLAERWGELNDAERADVTRAVTENVSTANLPPDIRDAILKAGLRPWLTR